MRCIRFTAMWIVNNIPCGILAPYLFGIGIGRLPHQDTD